MSVEAFACRSTERVPVAPARSPDREVLANFLLDRDACCPVCGYNLRALATDRCPECGRHLVLAVGTTEPKLGAFIAGLVGLASGFGFSALLIAYAIYHFMFVRGGGPPAGFLLPILVGTISCGLGIWVWLRSRRSLGRMATTRRWAWTAGCWVVGLLCPVWFILTVQ